MKRSERLESLASTIADYRRGEILAPSPAHVERWINQFPEGVRTKVLRETDLMLKNTYLPKDWVAQFLAHQVDNVGLTGGDAAGFWRSAIFLRIQQGGNSQRELTALFATILKERLGLDLEKCGSSGDVFVYLDDAIFSGTRLGTDLAAWLESDAPRRCTVHVLVIASHSFGEYKAKDRLEKRATELEKDVRFHIWRAVEFENRLFRKDVSEVLWPAEIPDDPAVRAYVASEEKFVFKPRAPGGTPAKSVFSSEAGRQVLEREFLIAGTRIRSFSQNPKRVMRPLGFSAFGVGFGATVVTYRNCPNNCPLPLWWGDPNGGPPLNRWYPLLPRKTYESSSGIAGMPF